MYIVHKGKYYQVISHANEYYTVCTEEDSKNILKNEALEVGAGAIGQYIVFKHQHVPNNKIFRRGEYIPYTDWKVLVCSKGVIVGIDSIEIDEHSEPECYATVQINGKTYNINMLALEPEPRLTTLKISSDGIKVAGLDIGLADSLTTVTSVYGIRGDSPERKDDYMKLLELWKRRKLDEIKEEYQVAKDKLVANDALGEFKEQFQAVKEGMLEHYENKGSIEIRINGFEYSQDTKEGLQELSEEYSSAVKEVEDLYEEVLARLEICESEESKIKVLKDYDILTKGGKLA